MQIHVIVGENTADLLVESDIILFEVAVKVRNVTGLLLDPTCHILPDMVLVEGRLVQHLFYVGSDMLVHHQQLDEPVYAQVHIPGAKPQMEVNVHSRVSNSLAQLNDDGTKVTLKTIVNLLVEVTEKKELRLKTGQGARYLFPYTREEKIKQEINESTIVLSEPAAQVSKVKAKIETTSVQIEPDNILIEAVIYQDIASVSPEDKVEYYQREQTAIRSRIKMPGVRPDSNIDLKAQVQRVKYKLISAGTRLRLKTTYLFMVKMLEEQELRPAYGSLLIKAQRIVGAGYMHKLVRQGLKLDSKVRKIDRVSGQVIEMEARVIDSKVAILGLLSAVIFFTSAGGTGHEIKQLVSFEDYLTLPGAQAGMEVKKTARVEAIIPLFDPAANSLDLKILLRLDVKVLQWVQALVMAEPG